WVRGVGGRVRGDEHPAEDAFQATFRARAKKAASIAGREAVASWLYQVAYRVALRARAGLAQRARRERPGLDGLTAPPPADEGEDLLRVLDEELGRLPAR